MKRLFNKRTVFCALLGMCLGIFIINTFVGTTNSTIMFILGLLTGFVIYEIDSGIAAVVGLPEEDPYGRGPFSGEGHSGISSKKIGKWDRSAWDKIQRGNE